METETGIDVPARRSVGTSPLGIALPLGVFIAGTIAFAAWTDNWYQTFKALHVLMAIVWIGGAFIIQLFAFRILRENDDQRLAKFTRDVEFIGMRTFVPASLILVVLGFVLMHKGGWQYHFWVIFALVVWALSVVSGAFYSGRVGRLIEERGGVDAEIRRRIEHLILHSRAELVLIALVAIDMVLKPGL
jgi:uncharacterized membrane protein